MEVPKDGSRSGAEKPIKIWDELHMSSEADRLRAYRLEAMIEQGGEAGVISKRMLPSIMQKAIDRLASERADKEAEAPGTDTAPLAQIEAPLYPPAPLDMLDPLNSFDEIYPDEPQAQLQGDA